MNPPSHKCVALAGVLLLSPLALPAGAGPGPKKLYHWPYLVLQPYTSASYIYYPNGDNDNKRAFYWGRVLGTDGLPINIRYLLPQLVENGWQEPLYTNAADRGQLFGVVTAFQATYASMGCGDNFLHVHAHAPYTTPPFTAEQIAEWRAAVIVGMTQRAELAASAGFTRILIDTEYSQQTLVSTDPQFWYDLGLDVITSMRAVNADFQIGFYPGLTNYWLTLTDPAWLVNPNSVGTYPDQTSIPADMRNMRHALLEGIYDNRGDTAMWSYEAWLYGPAHLCYGSQPHTYLWNLQDSITAITDLHQTLLGPGIEYMFAKWDLGSSQAPPVYKHWKQPNLSLAMHLENYQVIYANTDHAAIWDDYGGWDEDGAYYLTYADINDFHDALSSMQRASLYVPAMDVALESAYQHHSVTGETHYVSVPSNAPLAARLAYFDVYAGQGEYHVQGRLCDDFARYVNNLFLVTGKKDQRLPLSTLQEFVWAMWYKRRGFFGYHELVVTPKVPGQYGYLKPQAEIQVVTNPGNRVRSDFTGDGVSDLAQGYDLNANGPPELIVWPGLGNGRFETEGRVSIDSYMDLPVDQTFAMDFDGDGRAEIAQAMDDNGNGMLELFVRPNLGGGYVDTSTAKVSYDIADAGRRVYVIDFNGDDLGDCAQLRQVPGSAWPYDLVVRPNLNQWYVDAAVSYISYDFADPSGAHRLTDMTGDHKVDYVSYINEDGHGLHDLYIRWNLNDWHVDTGTPTWSYNVVNANAAVYLADFNGDGFKDVVQKYDDRGLIHLELFVRASLDGFHIGPEYVTQDVMISGPVLHIGRFDSDNWQDACEISDDNGNGRYEAFVRVNTDGLHVDTGTARYDLDYLFPTPVIGYDSVIRDPPPGDMNCDGVRDGLDVQAFTIAVMDPPQYGAAYPGCNILNGDFSRDDLTTTADVPGFVQCLLSGVCP